jgi:hypothetical protein
MLVDERLAELGELLALGLMWVLVQKSSRLLSSGDSYRGLQYPNDEATRVPPRAGRRP